MADPLSGAGSSRRRHEGFRIAIVPLIIALLGTVISVRAHVYNETLDPWNINKNQGPWISYRFSWIYLIQGICTLFPSPLPYPVSRSIDATDVLDYSTTRSNTTYTPSPNNWRVSLISVSPFIWRFSWTAVSGFTSLHHLARQMDRW